MSEHVPIHQWTHDGDSVLLVKCLGEDGKTHGGFEWPGVGGAVTADTWDGKPTCDGGGFFGWPWGFALGEGRQVNPAAEWLVFAVPPGDVVSLGGKAKARTASVVFRGTMRDAIARVRPGFAAWVMASSTGNGAHSATSGNRAHSATAGDDAHSATSGNWAHSATSGGEAHSATSGYGAHSATSGHGAHSATSGYGAHSATSGDQAHSATSGDDAHSATSGDEAHSSATGARSVAAACGANTRIRIGADGAGFLVWWPPDGSRPRGIVIHEGEGGIKAHTWYRCNPETGTVEECPNEQDE